MKYKRYINAAKIDKAYKIAKIVKIIVMLIKNFRDMFF